MLKKKLFLTSALCMAFACPAFAVDGNELIENGDTCNNTNLGTYEGTANVEAIWTLDPRTCTAGQSYDSTTNTCITCTAGNYCPGGTFNVNSETNGLNACPSGYALSESGAGSSTDCYRQCSTNDVAHSTGVSGGYYYGDNNQCSATSCAQGWHLKQPDLSQYTNTSPTTSETGNYAIITGDGDSFSRIQEENATYFGITQPMEWGNNLGFYQAKGSVRCSLVPGDDSTYQARVATGTVPDDLGTGFYCWTHITAVRANDLEEWKETESKWVFISDYHSAEQCMSGCMYDIGGRFGKSMEFRDTLFTNTTVIGPATCEANNIALKWYNDNTEVVPENNAAEQCIYNETITVPTNEPSKTGYTFGGWKLRTTTQEP